jgi:hypothetical protein
MHIACTVYFSYCDIVHAYSVADPGPVGSGPFLVESGSWDGRFGQDLGWHIFNFLCVLKSIMNT